MLSGPTRRVTRPGADRQTGRQWPAVPRYGAATLGCGERLVQHLDQALRALLTLVNGVAGAGRTVLAADWDPAVSAAVASPWAASHEALVASAAHLAEGSSACPATSPRVPWRRRHGFSRGGTDRICQESP